MNEVEGYVDQVQRMNKWIDQHPGFVIERNNITKWRGAWQATQDGVTVAQYGELEDLLDRLEQDFGLARATA